MKEFVFTFAVGLLFGFIVIDEIKEKKKERHTITITIDDNGKVVSAVNKTEWAIEIGSLKLVKIAK